MFIGHSLPIDLLELHLLLPAGGIQPIGADFVQYMSFNKADEMYVLESIENGLITAAIKEVSNFSKNASLSTSMVNNLGFGDKASVTYNQYVYFQYPEGTSSETQTFPVCNFSDNAKNFTEVKFMKTKKNTNEPILALGNILTASSSSIMTTSNFISVSPAHLALRLFGFTVSTSAEQQELVFRHCIKYSSNLSVTENSALETLCINHYYSMVDVTDISTPKQHSAFGEQYGRNARSVQQTIDGSESTEKPKAVAKPKNRQVNRTKQQNQNTKGSSKQTEEPNDGG